jgi:hypothetical protein
LDVRVDQSDVTRMVRELKTIDDKAVRALRTGLKVGLQPFAAQIQSSIPKTPPLSGMGHRGRTKWRGVNKPVIKFMPGRGRGGTRNLLVMTVTGGKRGVGFDMAELAGIRSRPGATRSRTYTRRVRGGGMTREMSHRVTSQGETFIEKLNERKPIRGVAGRYAYDTFLKMKPAIVETSRVIINGFMASYNNKFRL